MGLVRNMAESMHRVSMGLIGCIYGKYRRSLGRWGAHRDP